MVKNNFITPTWGDDPIEYDDPWASDPKMFAKYTYDVSNNNINICLEDCSTQTEDITAYHI